MQLALRAEPKGAESHTSGFEVLPWTVPCPSVKQIIRSGQQKLRSNALPCLAL